MEYEYKVHLHGVEKLCGCGGPSYVAEFVTYRPPEEDGDEWRWVESKALRVCISCGRGYFAEDTLAARQARKLQPERTVGVEEFTQQDGVWQIRFKKEAEAAMISSTRSGSRVGEWGCQVIEITISPEASVTDVIGWLATCPWNQPFGRIALQISDNASGLVRDAIVCGLSGIGFTEVMVSDGRDWVAIGGLNYGAIGTRYPTMALVGQEEESA